ncbi:hemicentin-1-like isoform X2 [Bufo gargarizans]|uniref:hemicentin-1-like isoform X2 n=1 Tax=Bufo gargarizans TaxID=30331 RepID=UPI001CF297A3|nr:hemicentin-1-like isoform X2 [Bufo gargarizans]
MPLSFRFLYGGMKSIQLLVYISLFISGAVALVQDIFAASGGKIVIPLDTRLEYTSGILCNRFVWTFKRPRQFLRQLAGVDDYCNKRDCNNERRPHCSLSTNGSLQLHDVKPDDAGEYIITTYHVNKAKSTEDTFNLHVLDAVSKPVISLSCVSEGQPVVLCRAEKGTNVSTSIIANGELLLEKAASEGEGQLFKVSSSAPWNISCSITNKVSQETINAEYSMCPVPLSELHLEMLCHLDRSVEITCKAENGSEPSFSWFVDGNPVRYSSSWKVTENVLSGSARTAVNITCSARNAISSVQSSVTSVSCPDAHSWTLSVFCKGLLFLQYNVLLISLIYDVIRSNRIGDLEKP